MYKEEKLGEGISHLVEEKFYLIPVDNELIVYCDYPDSPERFDKAPKPLDYFWNCHGRGDVSLRALGEKESKEVLSAGLRKRLQEDHDLAI